MKFYQKDKYGNLMKPDDVNEIFKTGQGPSYYASGIHSKVLNDNKFKVRDFIERKPPDPTTIAGS